jgi:hypothetical protein
MTSFAALPDEERALYWRNYSERTGVPEFIVEKDFWMCWLLGHIFATPKLGAECVFKGGTSLSTVFGAIDRFSEDIDLGLTPGSLGWNEADLDDAPSNSQRQKRTKQLQADCAEAVSASFMPELEALVVSVLGSCPNAKLVDLRIRCHISLPCPAVPLSTSGGTWLLYSPAGQNGVWITDGPAPHRHTCDHTIHRRIGAGHL